MKNWTELTKVTAEDLAEAYTDAEGVKYSRDRKRLLRIDSRRKRYTVAEGTEIICDNAFTYDYETEEEYEDSQGCTFARTTIAHGNFKLEEVTLPESLRVIGENAFYCCKELRKITIPHGVQHIGRMAFAYNSNLAEVELPDTLLTLGECAFTNTAIEEVDLPDSVTSISNAFYWCEDLRRVKFPAGLKTVEKEAFYNCRSLTDVVLPEGVVSIGEKAFAECEELKSVAIPEGVTSIGKEAFYKCGLLSAVELPASATELGVGLFRGCRALESATLGDNITSLPENLFYGCTNLTHVDIPSSVTAIGDYAFMSSGLRSVTLPEGLKRIGAMVFSGCKSLDSVAVPDTVTRIGNMAFGHNARIRSVSLPANLTKFSGDRIFLENDGIEEIVLPRGLKEIGFKDMGSCPALRRVVLPTVEATVDPTAFDKSENLEAIVIPHTDDAHDRRLMKHYRRTLPEGVVAALIIC